MKFKIANVDTDSFSCYKEEFLDISKEERESLLIELNSIMPSGVIWEDDGYYKTVIVFKAKNYVLFSEDGKIKYKGSSLKSSTLEISLKEYIDETVKCLLEDRQADVLNVYHKYVVAIHNVNKDTIKQWSSKKTLTEKVYNSDRLTERKLLEAVEGAEYSPGDKVFVYFNDIDSLSLVENFKEGCYNKERLLEKLYKVSTRFSAVINTEEFKNYKLKKNKRDLQELIGI